MAPNLEEWLHLLVVDSRRMLGREDIEKDVASLDLALDWGLSDISS